MEQLTLDQRAEVRRQVTEIPRSWWIFPDYVWVAGVLLGAGSLFYFQQSGIRVVALLATLYSVAQLGYRSGLLEGYAEGYESGHIGGVRKAFGITSEEADDIHDRAIDMKIDEGVIRHLDSKQEENQDKQA